MNNFLYEMEEVLLAYYSPETTQSEKLEAQNYIERILEESYENWENIMDILFSLPDSWNYDGIRETIKMHWPLQALSYIVQKRINHERIDKKLFYSKLFDLYREKMNIIQENSLFFGKFVLVFTNLALYDNWDENFNLTLTQFKNIIVESNGKDALVQARFLAKYFTYLYEDSFETIVSSKLSYK